MTRRFAKCLASGALAFWLIPLAALAQDEAPAYDPSADIQRQIDAQMPDMGGLGSLGLCTTLALFGFVGIIVVPLALRSARKGQKLAAQYNQGPPPALGLTKSGAGFAGSFQGYPATLTPHFDFNWAGMMTNLAWGKSLSKAAGGMGRQTFFHRYQFTLDVPGGQFPPTALYERDWWGVFGNVEYQRQKPPGQKLALEAGKNDVYGTDPQFAMGLLSSTELRSHAERWPYMNLQISGSRITLELIHHWNELESKFGKDGMFAWRFAEQGLMLMAAAARAASAIRPPGR